MAGWQSGHAADCKSVYAGSIPASASTRIYKIKAFILINFLYNVSFIYIYIYENSCYGPSRKRQNLFN